MNHAELLTALKAATGPSGKIDAKLHMFFHPEEKVKEFSMLGWRVQKDNGKWEPLPAICDSIDAALALVQEKLPPRDGWRFNIVDIGEERVGFEVHKPEWPGSHYEDAPTAPLAILIALLTALEAKP